MTEAPPKLSIVITCYNYADYVQQAIESAINQTYDNVEVIVVDDGSTDGSADVINGFAGQIHIIHQDNQGHIAAFNRGFRDSTGGLVVFLDADDVLEPTMAEQVVRAWSPDCVKVQYDLSIIDGGGVYLGRRFCNFTNRYNSSEVRREFRRLGTYTWPVTSGNAYSRWFLDRALPLDVPNAPDGALNTIAPLFGDIVTVPQTLASYRLHGGNMSGLSVGRGIDLIRTLGLQKRIEHRRTEISRLRQWAETLGIALPVGDILDNELPFLSYRLMALKLNESYCGRDADSSAKLWCRTLKLLAIRSLPLKQKAMHFLWTTIFALVPSSWPAGALIVMRFNRSTYLQPIRRFFGREVRLPPTESTA